MTHPASDDDKPLDPAVQRVEVRVRRLILIAGLTLGLGVFAVFAAILYRIAAYDTTARPLAADAPVPTLSAATLGLPAGARLVSTAADGGRVILTYEYPGGHMLVFLDAGSLSVVRKLALPDAP
jgi:hypothetical protein